MQRLTITLLVVFAVLQVALIIPLTNRLLVEVLVIVTDLEFFLMFGSWRESMRFVLKGERG